MTNNPTNIVSDHKRKTLPHAIDSLSKLIHAAKKEFHKQGKVVKSFECQNVIKKMKALKDKDEDSSVNRNEHHQMNNGPSDSRIIRLEAKLTSIKAFHLDTLVHECLRRVGLVHNSNLTTKQRKDNPLPEPIFNNHSISDVHDEFQSKLMEDMLGHKRLREAMERWNQKHSDFRARLSQQSRKGKSPDTMDPHYCNDKIHPGTRKRHDAQNIGKQKTSQPHELIFSNLFVDSLSGQLSHTSEDIKEKDVEDDDPLAPAKKKNRMGQKQRKAKAMAINAKKSGKTWSKSVNWRLKKTEASSFSSTIPTEEKKSSSGLKKGAAIQVGDVVNMGTSWKEEGKAHPSWAAREALKAKTSIVEFKGTKITFE